MTGHDWCNVMVARVLVFTCFYLHLEGSYDSNIRNIQVTTLDRLFDETVDFDHFSSDSRNFIQGFHARPFIRAKPLKLVVRLGIA